MLRACEAPKAPGEVINVASGRRISLNELLRTMNTIVGTDIQPIYQERAPATSDSQADITKARTLLGYTPLVGLEEGCATRSTGAGRRPPRRPAADDACPSKSKST